MTKKHKFPGLCFTDIYLEMEDKNNKLKEVLHRITLINIGKDPVEAEAWIQEIAGSVLKEEK